MKEIKALSDLTKLAIQLESGKNVDLNKAFNAYEKSLEMLKDIPMDADTKDALKQSQDALDQLKGLGGM
jgi:exonuclease VII small subunit